MASKTEKRPLLRWTVILLVVAGLGYAGWRYAFPADEAPKLLTERISRGDIEQSVLATGTLQASLLVSIGAQASGQIQSLKVGLGDVVKKGDPIAEIENSRQQNDLRNAQAALDNVKAQLAARQAVLKQADLAFKRQTNMLKQNATPREDFESAEATLATTEAEIAQLQAQIAQAEIEVDTAEVNLGYTKISAPSDGTVVAVVAQEGQTVNANQTTPTIVKLAQLDTMQVKAQISEADVIKVKPEQTVYFTILGDPEKRYYAKLESIEPAPESIATETTSSASSSSSSSSSAIYYNGLFSVPNPDGTLRISMTAQVHIVLAEAKDVLTVPSAALGRVDKDGTRIVRVLGEGDAEPHPVHVHVGINNNVTAQVLDGLTEGDRVVIGEAQSGAATSGQSQQRGGPPRRMMRL